MSLLPHFASMLQTASFKYPPCKKLVCHQHAMILMIHIYSKELHLDIHLNNICDTLRHHKVITQDTK